jgi:two-component sensor histidine kinase
VGARLPRKITAHQASKGRLGNRRAEKRNQGSKKLRHGSVGSSIRDDRARLEHQRTLRGRAYALAGERLTRELNHRLRNVFSTVLAIVKQTAARYPEAAEYRSTLERRLRALSAATGLLDRSESESVSILELIRLELAPFQEVNDVFASGPDISIRRVHAQDFAIVLHELTTNAVKYGALSDARGRLSVTWRLLPSGADRGSLYLEWIEEGGPKVEPPQNSGFGIAIIRESGTLFSGTASVEFAPEGFRYRLSIPGARLHRHRE